MPLFRSLKQFAGQWLERHYPRGLFLYYLYTRSHHCEPELWLVPQLLGTGGIGVDIGGNEGLWSMQMSRSALEVHTFEPNPICIAQLEHMLPPKAHLHKVALSDRSGTVQLRFDPTNTGIGTIEPRNELNDNPGIKIIQSVEVTTARLDDFNLNNVRLIKIDVEGHEEAVMAGALATIERNRPTIVCEIEERHNAGGLARVRALLEARGYTAMALQDGQPRAVRDIEAEGTIPIASAQGINNFIFVPDAATLTSSASSGSAL